MSDASLFLRKNKDKQRRRNPVGVARVPSSTNSTSSLSATRPAPSDPLARSASTSGNAQHGASSSAPVPAVTGVKPEAGADNPNITEIKIFSTGNSALRYNLMRLNSTKDVDPTLITAPVLMNRKKPGPKDPPVFALDENGKIVGRYSYDDEGKLLLDDEGKPVVETRERIDMSLVGQAPGAPKRKKTRKGTKEVFHQDIEIMRLRREEAVPWVLESGNPQERPTQPEQWVGRMVEQGALSTVLLCNDGTGEGFELVPLGRTYKFEPARPFKPLDSDAANKLYELQSKNKIHDRWALRPADNGEGSSSAPAPRVKVEHGLEERASRMESRIKLIKGMTVDRKPKVEKYEDDYKREGHRTGGGLEGGVGEELDFDEAEEFQDDDDNNTFYHDAREEEEARELEERLKKEFRMANANVGDRPQIAPEDDEDGLFGDVSLDDEGKKLRKIIRKRQRENGEDYDYDEDEESDSDTDSETDAKEDEKKKEEERKKAEEEKKKELANQSSFQPHSRPNSRPPAARTASPTSNRFPSPKKGKASTAPPGRSGASLIAQRATSRGASPRPTLSGPGSGRASSPLGMGRAASPENSVSRSASPFTRGNSPASGAATAPASRDASPAPSAGGPQQKRPRPTAPGRNDSASPQKDAGSATGASTKRKSSPSVSATGNNDAPSRPKKHKKTGSVTPVPMPSDIPPFAGMITKEDVLVWFRGNKKQAIPMNEAIGAFRKRIVDAGPNRDANQKLFLGWIRMVADQEMGNLRLKPEYR